MRDKPTAGLILTVLLIAGCGSRTAAVDDAQKKVGSTENQLQQAKGEPGAEQKVAELEKQLAEAKKQLAQAKGEPAKPEPPKAEPQKAAPATTESARREPLPPRPVEPPPPPKPREYVIPAGTPISVRTTTTISTKTATTGSPFAASLTKPLTVDGVVLAQSGAEVSGVVVQSDPGGRVKGKASMAVALKSIQGTHGRIAIATNSHEAIAPSTVKKDLTRGGIMTGVGAAIGAIAGGGKGAAIGAGIGAGAGAGTAVATRGAPAQIPSETVLTFTTRAPVTVTVQPRSE